MSESLQSKCLQVREYLQELRDPAHGAMRARFVKKMNDIEKEC